jgi:eukaryotic-like serine/threonine-protein kinase
MAGAFRRAAWSSDGKSIVYCDTTGLYTVPAMGGEPALIISHPHIEHPSFLDLPDGRRAFLFQTGDRPGVHDIFVQIEGERARRLVVTSTSNNPYPDYSPTGHIVYVDGDIEAPSIWALPFSLNDMKAAGKPFPIAHKASSPQVSRTGTLVYSDVPSNLAELVWRERSGKVLPAITDPRIYRSPSLSPDGRKVAVSFVQEGGPRIGVFDLQKPNAPLFQFDAPGAFAISWSPSSKELVYAAGTGGNLDIFSRAADGTSAAHPLVSTPVSEVAPEWSHDQKYLIYVEISAQTKGDILYREELNDGSLGNPMVFLKTEFSEVGPQFSPDGQYVAYSSNESGKFEVYVRGFPGGADKRQISTNGGAAPHWRRDGKEIIYMEGHKLMAVPVTLQPAFSSGRPSMLFQLGSAAPQFDVSADGKRFLVRQRLPEEKPLAVHVAHNWFSEFRERQ